MINRFYQRFSKHLVAMVLLTQLPVGWLALNVTTNNDTETWMPETSPARQRYEEFKRAFGAEEFLLIAFDTSKPNAPDAEMLESLCGRLERLHGRACRRALDSEMKGCPQAVSDQQSKPDDSGAELLVS